MDYKFGINKMKDKKAFYQYKKLFKINFICNNKLLIEFLLGCIIYFILLAINQKYPLFAGHGFLQFLLSVSLSLFLFSFFDENNIRYNTYQKISNALECSIFVKQITFSFIQKPEKIEITAIDVKYDSYFLNKKVAILLQIDDDMFKIISLLDNHELGKDKMFSIPSSKLKDINEKNYKLPYLYICEINSDKNENEIVFTNEINNKFMVRQNLV